MLDVVASGEEWPVRRPPAPAPRRVAEAAGAQGQSATDATPPTRVQKPLGSASTAPVSCMAPPVRSTAPAAASAPPMIPPADPALFVGGSAYAAVVKQTPTPQAARGRGRGGVSGAGEVRQGNFVTLPRHTPLGPRPPPGFPPLDQVREAPMTETASPSRDEPASVSTPSTSASWRSDPSATAPA